MTTYAYFVENSDLAESEVSEPEAEAMRVGEWESRVDLPDGVEFAPGRDWTGKPVRLHRTIAELSI